jgi:hypothetical protein
MRFYIALEFIFKNRIRVFIALAIATKKAAADLSLGFLYVSLWAFSACPRFMCPRVM